MLWFVFAGLVGFFIIPPLVAVFETRVLGAGPRDVGFWALARAIGGTCHVPWGSTGSPVVRFTLPEGEGRGRAVRRPRHRGWVVEIRSYQLAPIGFVSRLCCPAKPPTRWRSPGLEPEFAAHDDPHYLQTTSFETTDPDLLRWVLRQEETRRMMDRLQAMCGADWVELVLANSVIILRGAAPKNWHAGQAMEHIGPPLVDMVRRLSNDLANLGTALRNAGDVDQGIEHCDGCGAVITVDPWSCPGCGNRLHRGCRELLSGCATPNCKHVADPLPVHAKYGT